MTFGRSVVFSTKKTNYNDITELSLKVPLNTHHTSNDFFLWHKEVKNSLSSKLYYNLTILGIGDGVPLLYPQICLVGPHAVDSVHPHDWRLSRYNMGA